MKLRECEIGQSVKVRLSYSAEMYEGFITAIKDIPVDYHVYAMPITRKMVEVMLTNGLKILVFSMSNLKPYRR